MKPKNVEQKKVEPVKYYRHKGSQMNEQEITGNVTKITGKMKEQAGIILQDEKLQTEGKLQYLSGMLLTAYAKKKDLMFKTINKVIDAVTEVKVVGPVPVVVEEVKV